MTYSIIAHDPHTQQLGVAVQTCNLAVGAWVPWAEGGVGAVATQAKAQRSYGTLGLDLMRGGLAAPQALQALLAADEQREYRQVAMIDCAGRVAQHMGTHCLAQAGMAAGPGYATQANMMARDTVWGAMAAAFEEARERAERRQADSQLVDWLLAALEAAEAEGGDIRGRQTAALLVMQPQAPRLPLFDLRVDHHAQPVAELRRLVRLHRAYEAEYAISGLAATGERDQAYELVHKVLDLAPGEEYLRYLCAVHLAGDLQRPREALELLQELTLRRPVWREYLQRDVSAGVFGAPGATAMLYEALQEEEV